MPTHGSSRNVLDHNALDKILGLQSGKMGRPRAKRQEKIREWIGCGSLPGAEVILQAVLHCPPPGCVSLKVDWLESKTANGFQQFAFFLCAEKI